MLTRQIGSLVRGRTTPVQMLLASVLGAMLGFLPGFSRAPGAVVALVLLLVVLNANLGLAALVFAFSKLLSFLLLPVSFAVGRVLLDGPTQKLFREAINAPVLALFGFERYAVTGGLLLGALIGAGIGVLVVRAVGRLRRRLAALQADHAQFAAVSSTWWARSAAFLFLGGGHAATDWNRLAELRGGSPIRWVGVVLAAVVVAGLFALHSLLTGPLLASALQRGLQAANGATVDVGSAQLDLGEGRLTIGGLALADPDALDRDLFRATELTADVSGLDLLRRRVRLEHVVVRDAQQGLPRASPGRLYGWREAAPPEPAAPPLEPGAAGRKLEEYVKNYRVWRERLTQARRWLERLAPRDERAPGDGETLSERLEREAEESGYADVVARHLVEGAPTLLITELRAEGVTAAALPGEVLDVRAENLSTQPALVDGTPRVTVDARSGNLALAVGLGGLARTAGDDSVRFALRGLPVDRVAGDLVVGGVQPLSGGTLDVALDGRWAGGVGNLDLPLAVTLHDTTLNLGGRSAPVSRFELPIGLRGPLDDLTLTIDDAHLVDALRAAGAAELSRRVDEERDKLLEKAGEKAQEAQGELQEKAREALGGLLGGKQEKPDDAAPVSKKKEKP